MSPSSSSSSNSSPFRCIADSFKKMYRLMFRNQKQQKGQRQSPVDIRTETVFCDKRKCEACSLSIVTQPGDCDLINISPSTWKVSTSPECQTVMKASHLPAAFRLLQFHAHWGADSTTGSEHTLNGKQYAGEVHFVFWNTSYGNPEVACAQPDGIAVLAVFLTEGKHSEEMERITRLVEQCVEEKKETMEVPKEFEITSIIPLGSEYFSYDGSLTTPPYSETVLWTVMIKPLEISQDQMNVFRRICPSNYRECQPLHGRIILSSFEISSQHILV